MLREALRHSPMPCRTKWKLLEECWARGGNTVPAVDAVWAVMTVLWPGTRWTAGADPCSVVTRTNLAETVPNVIDFAVLSESETPLYFASCQPRIIIAYLPAGRGRA